MPSMHFDMLITNPDIHSPNKGLTWQFKSRKKTLKEVFAGVRHGNGPKLWNCNAIVLLVGLVAVADQEATFVSHLAIWNFELVQESHAIKPVVESWGNGRSRRKQLTRQLIYQPFKDAQYLLLVSNLKLSWSIPQEVSADPFWNFANDVSSNRHWSFIHWSDNLVNARQTMHICKVVNLLLSSSFWLGFLNSYCKTGESGWNSHFQRLWIHSATWFQAE